MNVGGDMNETDWAEVHRLIGTNPLELAHRYIALLGAPEPVYEYRVVCGDGTSPFVDQWETREDAERRATAFTLVSGDIYTVERRVVGPWEAT